MKLLFFKRLLTAIVILSLPLFVLFYSRLACAENTDYIDTHMHLNVQGAGTQSQSSGRGMSSRRNPATGPKSTGNIGRRGQKTQQTSTTVADYDAAAQSLIVEMDRCGIKRTLVMPPPQVPKQRNICTSQDLLTVVKKYPDRLVFVGGGDTLNRLIHKYQPSEVTPEIRSKFEKMAEELIRSGAKGFGETAALHFSFTSHHVFEEVSPDHPLFLLLADLSARYNVPIDFHMEAVPQDMAMPVSFNRLSPNNPSTLKANIPAFERLLAHNRDAKIVWQHIGWDNTGFMTIELLRRLLQAHPNLYLSLRVEKRQYDMTGKLMPNRIVDAECNLRPEWLKFISDFPDRFMLGTDAFFGTALTGPGQQPLPQTLEDTWRIIEQLPPELARKIGGDNACQVYNLK